MTRCARTASAGPQRGSVEGARVRGGPWGPAPRRRTGNRTGQAFATPGVGRRITRHQVRRPTRPTRRPRLRPPERARRRRRRWRAASTVAWTHPWCSSTCSTPTAGTLRTAGASTGGPTKTVEDAGCRTTARASTGPQPEAVGQLEQIGPIGLCGQGSTLPDRRYQGVARRANAPERGKAGRSSGRAIRKPPRRRRRPRINGYAGWPRRTGAMP